MPTCEPVWNRQTTQPSDASGPPGQSRTDPATGVRFDGHDIEGETFRTVFGSLLGVYTWECDRVPSVGEVHEAMEHHVQETREIEPPTQAQPGRMAWRLDYRGSGNLRRRHLGLPRRGPSRHLGRTSLTVHAPEEGPGVVPGTRGRLLTVVPVLGHVSVHQHPVRSVYVSELVPMASKAMHAVFALADIDLSARGSQRRRGRKRRRTVEVDSTQRRGSPYIPIGECGQIPLRLDQLQEPTCGRRRYRSRRPSGIGRDDHHGHAKAQTIVGRRSGVTSFDLFGEGRQAKEEP